MRLVDPQPEYWRSRQDVAIRCGLCASELRGLRWSDVDFKRGELHVQQRADRYSAIGRPKSDAGDRKVPIPPTTLQALREWKLICPKRDTSRKDAHGNPIKELHFVFPNGTGNVESHSNIVKRGPIKTLEKAGVTVVSGKDDDGKPLVKAKYTGLHALRHYFASWCINRKMDGGCELPLKVVQARLGHSSIAMTADRYGHLFARGDDTAELAAAEGRFG